jgi:hypothetical protein
VRFVCEWCHEKIHIGNTAAASVEVLAHIGSCDRRSEGMTLKQTAGLANHIASLLSIEEFTCPGCGDAIQIKIGSWLSIQGQVLDHFEGCDRTRSVELSATVLRLIAHRITDDFERLRIGR